MHNFLINPHVRLFFGWLVGRSVIIYFNLKYYHAPIGALFKAYLYIYLSIDLSRQSIYLSIQDTQFIREKVLQVAKHFVGSNLRFAIR